MIENRRNIFIWIYCVLSHARYFASLPISYGRFLLTEDELRFERIYDIFRYTFYLIVYSSRRKFIVTIGVAWEKHFFYNCCARTRTLATISLFLIHNYAIVLRQRERTHQIRNCQRIGCNKSTVIKISVKGDVFSASLAVENTFVNRLVS